MPDEDADGKKSPDAGDATDEDKKNGGKKDADTSKKDAGKKGGDDNDDGDDKPKGKFYTDEKLNKIVENRLKREREKLAEDSKLSETDRLKKDAADALGVAREANLRSDFLVESNLPADKANRIFKLYRDDIEVDDNGKPINIKEVLDQAKKDFPELFKATAKAGGKGDPGEGTDENGKKDVSDMNALMRGAVRR